MTPAAPHVDGREAPADDTPPDGYGVGFLLHRIADDIEELCGRMGLDCAQDEIASILLSHRNRKRQQ